MWEEWVPACLCLRDYSLFKLQKDVVAGVTVGIMAVPQGMAYAAMLKLPPVFGLYCSLVPAAIYFLLGTSSHLVVGPTAVMSSLVSQLAARKEEYFVYSLLSGIFLCVVSMFGLGFLAHRILSKPVVYGFTAAAGTLVIKGQMSSLLGVKYSRIQDLFFAPLRTEAYLGVGALILLLLFRYQSLRVLRWCPKTAVPLFIIVFCTYLTYILHLHENSGVNVIGAVRAGFPQFQLPKLKKTLTSAPLRVVGSTMVISLFLVVEALSIAQTFAVQWNYQIVPNQELFALGLANVGGGFFSAYPVTGSLSRTAVCAATGAMTRSSNLFCSLTVLATLLFFTKFCYYMPLSVLSAIVIASAAKIVDVKFPVQLWLSSKKEFCVYLASFLLFFFMVLALH